MEYINSRGTTVIIATHDKEIVNRMHKRVIHLVGGHIVREFGRGLRSMKTRSLRVCFRQGLQGIWRNRLMVIASVCTVSACLFILGVVYCLVANVRQFADDLDDSLGIIAFLSEDVSDDGVTSLVSQIEGMDGVKEVVYVSADGSVAELQGFDGL